MWWVCVCYVELMWNWNEWEWQRVGEWFEFRWGHGWLLICMIDMSEGGVCLCVHPQWERGILGELEDSWREWFDWGAVKMKMSDGMFQNNQKSSFHLFLFSSFFFSTLFHTSTPSHPPSTQNLLYFSHDVHPDDYGSDCVVDDCCFRRRHTSTSWHNFESLFIEQCWWVCLMLCELW